MPLWGAPGEPSISLWVMVPRGTELLGPIHPSLPGPKGILPRHYQNAKLLTPGPEFATLYGDWKAVVHGPWPLSVCKSSNLCKSFI